jgi:hypothetical protein
MGFRFALIVGSLLVTLAGDCRARDRFDSGWLKGFTKSPTEHIIDEPDKPFTVRAVKGIVLDPSGAEMEGVVVEIRDGAGQIRGTKTNRQGTFKLDGVPKGTYKFKITMNGFQSVVGDIIISNNANKKGQMKIVMKVGV